MQLEYLFLCAPLWAGALSARGGKTLSNSLERVQRNFCRLIHPNLSYTQAIASLHIQKISERVVMLTKKFAVKMAENPKFSYMFPKFSGKNTRSMRLYHEPKWKSLRYGYSTIPFCIRLLNGET